MPKFKLSLSEPDRMFRPFGDLEDGAVVDADVQPPDGVTWSWAPEGNPPVAVTAPLVVPASLTADVPPASS